MKRQRTHISHVYLVSVEDPDDYYHKPEGVLFIDNLGNHTLYSADSRFNFLRNAVHKFPYKELEEGVAFRDHEVRITDLTDTFRAEFELTVDDMLEILKRVYESSPLQLFFLEKHLDPQNYNQPFVP
ncbi:hypothetical protein [Tumebacillus permanentifrigoris]|uniref:Uncharacterized protein n=1 Tax=Tumebacillus permanentifrigoris TaxID=378543 RepID=A0A316DBJ3_9BACL|nr:hypothetical protein [Tumebacillus permanentifrigoris]PWK14360.1 hypothetical protein C7459_105117 [Tumebacillus permanentifrigoris]